MGAITAMWDKKGLSYEGWWRWRLESLKLEVDTVPLLAWWGN